ncbi:Sec-independent protein translocase subunit TatA [Antribacter sp. KLBMP9083]|uniref:Sec-independent protein translocase protein TatA n=1 Tax=Antribacter soli TaxID=2910976 RepID=A0AA41QCU4_9MICO|nr:Sec-independent protein translocase subunit TatA [Antribacter soli]MCF4120833.1 Sec-independent protein translocase subunit TatA [Antribacter soli]
MGALQPWHWIVLLAVILLLFGANRLPGLAKGIGQSMKIFKNEISDLRDDKKDATPTDAAPTAAPQSAPQSTPQTAPKDNDTPKV